MLTRLGQSVLQTFRSVVHSPSRQLHTSQPNQLTASAALLGSWGGGKLKTHTGTAKRFKPVGKRRLAGEPVAVHLDPDGRIASYDLSKGSPIGVMYKRGQTGKRHLNSKMHHIQETRLRGTKLIRSGHMIRTLNRLIGSHF